MSKQIRLVPHTLQFKFDARTSRGAMQQHQVYYLVLSDSDKLEQMGVGECAPLPGLSLEYHPDYLKTLERTILDLNFYLTQDSSAHLESIIYRENIKESPALKFALETAFLDFQRGGEKQLFLNSFTAGKTSIPINGLVWMGDKMFMQEQIQKKLQEGYSCLKLKIGSLDFATELELIQSIRQVASATELTIRLDANGAFAPHEALEKMNKLAAYQIHSIEQPIRAGQRAKMADLCRNSPVPIALDEELIGINQKENKAQLLQGIKPQYIILKPTLLGGFRACSEWITLAESSGVGWWITSALESNIGLNAISQFTAEYPVKMEQGLGTGQLYHNNLASPLTIQQGELYYQKEKFWDNTLFN